MKRTVTYFAESQGQKIENSTSPLDLGGRNQPARVVENRDDRMPS